MTFLFKIPFTLEKLKKCIIDILLNELKKKKKLHVATQFKELFS
jgi:hypothetical protein